MLGVITASEPSWIAPFTGLSLRSFGTLVAQLRHEGADAVRRGRPWSLPLEDRVFLVTAYWRTNLTLRQLAPLFGVSKSAANRIVSHLGPLLALKPRCPTRPLESTNNNTWLCRRVQRRRRPPLSGLSRPTPPGRPADEYRPVTDTEWRGFEEHFDHRKVELGGCARPYRTPCQHEHACLRCPMLNINPKMLPRLDEIETDLLARRARAEQEGWLGEIEGIDLTLTFLREKREESQRLARIAPVNLGMPGLRSAESDR